MKTYTIKEIKEQGIWVKTDNVGANAKKILLASKCPNINQPEMHYNAKYYRLIDGNTGYDFRASYQLAPDSFIEFNQIDFDDFVLPQYWYVKVDEENLEVLSKWRFQSSYPGCKLKIGAITGCGNFSWNNTGTVRDHSSSGDPEFYINEIKFEQFKKYVLKENTMEKEIIGYKCPIKLYGTVNVGTIFVKPIIAPNALWYTPEEYKDNQKGVQMVPKEIVETWEPVYKEEELKIGDYSIEFKKHSIVVNNHEYDKEDLLFIDSISKRSKDNSVKLEGTIITDQIFTKILNKLKNG